MSLAELHQTTPAKPAMISLEHAKSIDLKTVRDLTLAHLNPGQLHYMRLLGFDRVLIQRAEGAYYIDTSGRKILDFFGGFGSVAFGHNHPRIVEARKTFQDEQRQEICMAFMSQYASVLAHNLAEIAPGNLEMVFLGSSGSEAMEAALKIAEQAQGPAKSTIVYAENSFHGKTKGVLAVTDGALYRSQFQLPQNTRKVAFADAGALQSLFESDPTIGILVLETIQGGGGIIEAPANYWREVRRLCDKHDVLWIADEVQCGMGRTGRFFAFENYAVVPDITALAKALGGSKCAMAAMISTRDVFMKAYGQPKKAMIHAHATFGGIGEACATSIEALHVLYDEGMMENAACEGDFLLAGLRKLQEKYPHILRDIRGKGLMIGIEFQDISQTMPFGLRQLISILDEKLKGSLCGFTGALMLAKHDVLVAFTEYNRNVIRIEPPLNITRAESEKFLNALDDILTRGVTGIVKHYISTIAMG